MASQEGKRTTGRKRSRKLNYFFLDVADLGPTLHKSLHINRGGDIITAWSYPQRKRVGYTYSDVRRRMETAFTTKQVSEMVNRSRVTIENAILEGAIEEPQYTYGINEVQKKYKYMWHEKNIMALHTYLSSVHRGRPRKDGLITASNLPNSRELRAMIHQKPVMGYLDEDGKFVPTWQAQ